MQFLEGGGHLPQMPHPGSAISAVGNPPGYTPESDISIMSVATSTVAAAKLYLSV